MMSLIRSMNINGCMNVVEIDTNNLNRKYYKLVTTYFMEINEWNSETFAV